MCHARLNYEINASFETERKVRSDRFLPRGAIRPIWRGDARSLSRLSRRGQRLDNYWQTLWHPSHGEMPVNIYGERRRTKIHAAQSVINLFSRTLGRVWFDESSCVFRDYAPIMENSRSGNRQHLRLRTQLFLILLHELPYLLSVQRRDSRRTIFDSVYQYLWIGTRSRVTCFLRCVSLFRHISRYTCNSTLFKYISQRDAPESTHTRTFILYPSPIVRNGTISPLAPVFFICREESSAARSRQYSWKDDRCTRPVKRAAKIFQRWRGEEKQADSRELELNECTKCTRNNSRWRKERKRDPAGWPELLESPRLDIEVA